MAKILYTLINLRLRQIVYQVSFRLFGFKKFKPSDLKIDKKEFDLQTYDYSYLSFSKDGRQLLIFNCVVNSFDDSRLELQTPDYMYDFSLYYFEWIKKYKENNLKHEIMLNHGSLLIMSGTTQHYWMHEIPRTAKPIGPRINLTFRVIRY